MLTVLMVSALAVILLILGISLSMKSKLDREKASPFECGFTPKFMARLPFSIRFFLVALIFLIFDVELILIFPVIPASLGSDLSFLTSSMATLLMILLLGLFHEIFEGSLSWALW